MSDNDGITPERIIQRMLKIGVAAITAEPELLDAIVGFTAENDAERTKIREFWIDNPPDVYLGYPRKATAKFPCYAVTLTNDAITMSFIGLGEGPILDEADEVVGTRFLQEAKASYTILVYAEHPEVCVHYYRVLRRIVNVGIRYLIAQGINEPEMESGTELIPDPQYAPENLFVRRLMLSAGYSETWTDQDSLWEALNGAPEATANAVTIDVHHEDQGPRGVQPYTPGEED